jgi:hypothetical protein
MTGNLTIHEIVQQLHSVEEEFNSYCNSITDEKFFYQPKDKWSPAQQVKHLITSTNMACLVFKLPRFMVRMIAGKPNRNSRTYDELVAKYKLKLEQGGKASKKYIPKPIAASYGKEKLLNNFTKSMNKFALTLSRKWDESSLDKYIAPHPLLGKITLRELCYFTIYHTPHHLHNIKVMTEINKPG